MKKNYILTIKPAFFPEERHKVERYLESIGYKINGSGTFVDMSSCDISFCKTLKSKKKEKP